MSHSSVERVLLPQTFLLVDYMLDRVEKLLRELRIFSERMQKMLAESLGLPFSEGLLLALVRAGMARKEAYLLTAELSMEASQRGIPLWELARENYKVRAYLSQEEIEAVFDLNEVLKRVEVSFDRVFRSRYNSRCED